MSQTLQLPPKVEYYHGQDDVMRDFRTDDMVPAHARKSESYVTFALWFNDMVEVYVRDGHDREYAAAFVAQDLVRPFVQRVKN